MTTPSEGIGEPGSKAGGPASGPRQRQAGCHRVVWLAILGLVVLSVLACLGVVLLATPPAGSATAGGLPITVCAGVAVQPYLQAGLVWVSPISSYLPPLAASDYAICVRVPSPPRLSGPWGGWTFPP